MSSATMSINYIYACQYTDLVEPVRPTEIRSTILDGGSTAERLTGATGANRINAGAAMIP